MYKNRIALPRELARQGQRFQRLRKFSASKAVKTDAKFAQSIVSITKKSNKKLTEKLDEILCIEKEILPETKTVSAVSSVIERSNLISVSNKSGKHRIDIMTPNIKNNLFTNSFVGVPSIIIRNLKLFPMLSNQMDFASKLSDVDDKILKVPSNGDTLLMKFPSVTKILDQTMSEESRANLEKWKQAKIAELGLEGFELFNKAQLERGKQFHELISQYYLTKHGVNNVDVTLEGVWSSVLPLLKNITSPKAIESHVVHPVLKYRGIVDCIATYQDKPTLIEWKKSDKPKPSLSSTFDNPVQLAAYFGAISHDPNYKQLNVRDALLVIAYTDGSPADAFHLNADKMRTHWAAWLTRLERYWTANETQKDAIKRETDGNS